MLVFQHDEMQQSKSTPRRNFCVWICCIICLLGALSVSSAIVCLCMNVLIVCVLYVIACMLYTIFLGLVIYQIKFWNNYKPRKMWAWDSKMSQALALLAGAVYSTEFSHGSDTLAVTPWINSKQDGFLMIFAMLLKFILNGLMDL